MSESAKHWITVNADGRVDALFCTAYGPPPPVGAIEISSDEAAIIARARAHVDCRYLDGAIVLDPITKESSPAREACLLRVAEIEAVLIQIDAHSARPLRSLLLAQQAGDTPEPGDIERLAELEAQAKTLRDERRELTKPGG